MKTADAKKQVAKDETTKLREGLLSMKPATDQQLNALRMIRDLAISTLELNRVREEGGYCGSMAISPMAGVIRRVDTEAVEDALAAIEGMARLNRVPTNRGAP